MVAYHSKMNYEEIVLLCVGTEGRAGGGSRFFNVGTST